MNENESERKYELSDEDMRVLVAHGWPGHVREPEIGN